MNNFNVKKIETVSKIEDNKNNIILDNPEDEPVNMANVDELTVHMINFLEFISQPEMEKLENDNNELFVETVTNKFKDFSDNYVAVFNKLLDKKNRNESVERLVEMFSIIKNIKNGKSTFEKEDARFKEKLNEQYIYKKYGGKKQFENAMRKNKK